MCGAGLVSATLVLAEPIFEEFAAAARNALETAGVLLARVVEDDSGGIRLLARSMHWVADDEYHVRSGIELQVGAATYIKPLAQAEKNSEIAIWVHTHPGGFPPVASEKDLFVDEQIADVFR